MSCPLGQTRTLGLTETTGLLSSCSHSLPNQSTTGYLQGLGLTMVQSMTRRNSKQSIHPFYIALYLMPSRL